MNDPTHHAHAQLPRVVTLTQELVAIGAGSGNEGKVADVVVRAMAEHGFRDISRDRLGNIVGFVGPKGHPVALLFDSHMDVVPVSGEWTTAPFAGELRNGRLYGRGTTDMKGALAASICGVAEAARTGELRQPVAVSASVLEETVEGGALGEVLEAVRPQMTVICEPSSMTIKTGQRGRIEILVKATGIPAHAAHPERGKNANLLAAKALIAIDEMPLKDDDEFGAMVMVATDICSSPYPLISALPESVTIRFDRRIGLSETKASVLLAVKKRLAEIDPQAFEVTVSDEPVRTYTGVEVRWERYLSAWSQSSDQPLAKAAAESLRQAGLQPRFGTYAFCTNGSESAGMRKIATIGLGPGDERDAHTTDESIAIEALTDAVVVYRNLVLEIAGGRNDSRQ